MLAVPLPRVRGQFAHRTSMRWNSSLSHDPPGVPIFLGRARTAIFVRSQQKSDEDMPLKTDLEFTTAQATPSISRAFDGFAVEHFEFQESAPFDYAREGDSWYLALHDIQLEAAEARISDGQRSERLDLRDTLTLLPPSARIEGWSKPLTGRHSFIALYFSPELLAPELGRQFETTRLQPVLYGRDRAVSLTMRKMTKLLREGAELLAPPGGRRPSDPPVRGATQSRDRLYRREHDRRHFPGRPGTCGRAEQVPLRARVRRYDRHKSLRIPDRAAHETRVGPSGVNGAAA